MEPACIICLQEKKLLSNYVRNFHKMSKKSPVSNNCRHVQCSHFENKMFISIAEEFVKTFALSILRIGTYRFFCCRLQVNCNVCRPCYRNKRLPQLCSVEMIIGTFRLVKSKLALSINCRTLANKNLIETLSFTYFIPSFFPCPFPWFRHR